MFGLFKRDPQAKLRRAFENLMREARDLQRNGDIQGYAAKIAEADAIAAKLDDKQSGGKR